MENVENPVIDADLAEFMRLVEKANRTRIEIVRYLGIGERTLYRWLKGETRVPKMAIIALKVLVNEIE